MIEVSLSHIPAPTPPPPECTWDIDCAGHPNGPVCDSFGAQTCHECISSSHCSSPANCDPAAKKCVVCSANYPCSLSAFPPAPTCDEAANDGEGTCVACVDDSDCPLMGVSPNNPSVSNGPYCATDTFNKTWCVECTDDAHCTGEGEKMLCACGRDRQIALSLPLCGKPSFQIPRSHTVFYSSAGPWELK